MMPGRLILCLLLLLGSAAHAQGLTPAECEEVRRTYGIIPGGCRNAPQSAQGTQGAPPAAQPTQAQLESHVFFPEGGARLDDAAVAQIGKLARILVLPPLSDGCLRLVGHSDNSGAAEANRALSERRAKLVADALTAEWVDPARVEQIVGLGEKQPLESGSNAVTTYRRQATGKGVWRLNCAVVPMARARRLAPACGGSG